MFSQTSSNRVEIVRGLDVYRLDTTDLPNYYWIEGDTVRFEWDFSDPFDLVYPVKKSELVTKLEEVLAETHINAVIFDGRFANNTFTIITIPRPNEPIYDTSDLYNCNFDEYVTLDRIHGFKVKEENLVNTLRETFANPEYKVLGILRIAEDTYFLSAIHRGSYVPIEQIRNNDYYLQDSVFPRILELRSGFVFDTNRENSYRDRRLDILVTEDRALRHIVNLVQDGNVITNIRNRHAPYYVITFKPR